MGKELSFLKGTGQIVLLIGIFVAEVSAVLLTFTFVIPSLGMFANTMVSGSGITGFAVFDASAQASISSSQSYQTASMMFVWMLIGIVFIILGNNIIPARKY